MQKLVNYFVGLAIILFEDKIALSKNTRKIKDYNVKFITGTDEHGLKVEKAAKKKKINPVNSEFLQLFFSSKSNKN